MTPEEMALIMPSDLTFYIGSSLWFIGNIVVNLHRNGYNIYIDKYRDMLFDYCHATNELDETYDDHYYNEISYQFEQTQIDIPFT